MNFSSLPFSRHSPVNNTITWQGEWAGSEQCNHAVARTRAAQASWGSTSIEQRLAILERFASSLQAHAAPIATAITLESGKPLWESLTEVQSSIAKVSNAIAAMRIRRSDCIESNAAGSTAVRYRSLGTVLVLGPYNLPLHLPGAHIVPAILAGNCVIFKPSEKAAAVGDWIAQCWRQAELPEGVLEVVHGGVEVAQHLAQQNMDGVFFTGSYRGGVALHRLLAGRPECLLALEMGGNNPLVIEEVSDHRAAIQTIIASAYITSGQRCTCARRIVAIDTPENRRLVDMLVSVLAKVRVGDPLSEPQPYMGALVSAEASQQILRAQSMLARSGATTLVSCKETAENPCILTPGLSLVMPNDENDEEYFGPLATLCFVDDMTQAITIANRTRYGLAAGLLSDNRICYERFLNNVRAGIVNWNSPTTGASGKLPFGGVGASGNHRPSGFFAADYCSYPIASVEKTSLQTMPTSPGLEDLF